MNRTAWKWIAFINMIVHSYAYQNTYKLPYLVGILMWAALWLYIRSEEK